MKIPNRNQSLYYTTLSILIHCALYSTVSALPIRFLAWDASVADRKMSFQSGSSLTALEDLTPFTRSKPFETTGGQVALFLVASDRTGSDGKPASTPITFTPGITAALVVILPDTNHPTGLRTFTFDDSLGKFEWGSIRFVNATGKELLVKCDETVISVPASWSPADFQPGGATRNLAVQAVVKDNPKELVYSSIWKHNPEVRNLVLLTPSANPQSRIVNFKTIPEDRRILSLDAAASKAQQSPAP